MNTVKNAVLIFVLSAAMILLACCSPAAPESNAVAAVTDGVYDPTEQPAPDGEKTYRIVPIGGDSLGDGADRSVITKKVVISKDPELIGSVKTFEFAGITYELTYKETVYYLFGGYITDFYSFRSGGAELSVQYLRDGTVISVRHRAAFKLDIGEGTDEELFSAVEDYFADMFAFGSFEHKKIYRYDDVKFYDLLWYNKKGDLMTDDWLSISIRTNGDFSLFINKNAAIASFENAPDNIVIDDYSADIEAMLEEMFNDPSESYVIDRENCYMTIIEGRFAVYIRVERYDSNGYLVSYPEFAVFIDG